MKTLNFNKLILSLSILRHVNLVVFTFFIGLAYLNSQTYNPKNGYTHWPNGTVYVCNCVQGYGPEPVVVANGETVGCFTNEERCKELLEEADDDAAAGGGDAGGTDSAEPTTQSLTPEMNASFRGFKKQLKKRKGVWANQNGKWIYATNSREWTQQIINSWNKKK